MFRHLDFRSYFNFLRRNRLYTAINLFGLGISLMFVLLIADFTLRQFTTDDYHSKADRIYAIGTERDVNSGYYLQKHLRERYPEIESTCAVAGSGGVQPVEAGQRKYSATILFADSTFFRFFDFPLLKGDGAEALGARDNVVLSESFARKVFAGFDPVGQTIRFTDEEKSYVVSGVVRDIDRSIFPNSDILMRAERLCDINPANDERMSNCGAVTTFLLAKPGADLGAKIPDMVSYFKEIYWPYRGNVVGQVTLTPLREVYFSPLNTSYTMHRGSWPFVMILFGVGAVILVFAVMNYVNLTVAQTGFRAKEMAARRLMGATRGGIVCKLILESTLLCAAALVVALFLAVAAEPCAERLLESKLDLLGDLTPLTALCCLLFTLLLGLVAGIVPAWMVARCKPIDIVRGQFRSRSKMHSGKVLITLQNAITICLVATTLVMGQQIRHLISAPLGYHTKDILDISTDIFDSYARIRAFREELQRLPCVEAVAMSCGTPHDRGNNNTVQRGPDEMVSVQTFIADSVYFRILGLERLHDNRETDPDDAWFVNQHTLRVLDIDESTPEVKLGEDYSWGIHVAGVYRDFQVGSALDAPTAVLLRDIGDFDRWWTPTGFVGKLPLELAGQNHGRPCRSIPRHPGDVRTGDRRGCVRRRAIHRAADRGGLRRTAARAGNRRNLHAHRPAHLDARAGGHVHLLHPAEATGDRRAQGVRLHAGRGAAASDEQFHAAGRCGFRCGVPRDLVPDESLAGRIHHPHFAFASRLPRCRIVRGGRGSCGGGFPELARRRCQPRRSDQELRTSGETGTEKGIND